MHTSKPQNLNHYLRLLFGFMSVTAFLSMWLSNTATTAMMFPIAQAVLQELREGTRNLGVINNGTAFEMDSTPTHTGTEITVEDKQTKESTENGRVDAKIVKYERYFIKYNNSF